MIIHFPNQLLLHFSINLFGNIFLNLKKDLINRLQMSIVSIFENLSDILSHQNTQEPNSYLEQLHELHGLSTYHLLYPLMIPSHSAKLATHLDKEE